MLLEFDTLEGLDPARFMEIYREGNEENAAYFYPDAEDKAEAIRKVEADFLDYLRRDFFSREGSRYLILEEKGLWVSALRLYFVEEGLWYLEALETRPDCRRQGYGAKILTEALEYLKGKGPFRLADCVSKRNVASLKTHEKCGFTVATDPGYDYLQKTTDEDCFGMEYRWEGQRP